MKSISKMTKLLLGGWLTFVFVSFLNLPFVTSALAITLNPGDFIVADYNKGRGDAGRREGGRP